MLRAATAWVLQDPRSLRIGIQSLAGVAVLMTILSPPAVWDGFSFNPPFMTPQQVLIFFNVVIASRISANLPAFKLFLHTASGAVIGALMTLATSYITWVASGGSYAPSNTRVGVLLAVTTPATFGLTLLRSSQAGRRMLWLYSVLVLAVSTVALYRTETQLWRFPLWFAAYISLAGLSATLASTIFVPTSSGAAARQALAASFEGVARVVRSAVGLYTAAPSKSGQAGAAEEKNKAGVAIDDGAFGLAWPVHQASAEAEGALRTAFIHISAARWEVDLYRPTHWLPIKPFAAVAFLCRACLGTATLLLCPVETGTMNLELCAKFGAELQAAAGSLEGCCKAVGQVLKDNAPVMLALDAFHCLHQDMAVLCASIRGAATDSYGSSEAGVLAFHTVASFMITLYSKMRQLLNQLPAALARDQPASAEAVKQRLAALPACEVALLTQRRQQGRDAAVGGQEGHAGCGAAKQRQLGSPALGLLQGQLAEQAAQALLKAGAGPVGGSLGGAAERQMVMDRLCKRSVHSVQAAPEPSLWQRLEQRLLDTTGLKPADFKLALQQAVSYFSLMWLVIPDDVFKALGGRVVWGLIIVVVLQEHTSGSSIAKGVFRLLGTFIGGAAGIGIYFFAVLCNGLSHANRPPKFIITSLGLAVFSGVCSLCASRDPARAYMWVTATILGSSVSLTGLSDPQWVTLNALWRLGMTGIGMVVNYIVVTLVFPVTSMEVLKGQAASALGAIATAAEDTIISALPPEERPAGSPRGGRHQGPLRAAVTEATAPAVQLATVAVEGLQVVVSADADQPTGPGLGGIAAGPAAAGAGAPAGSVELLSGLQRWLRDLQAPLGELVQQEPGQCQQEPLGPSFLRLVKNGHGASMVVSDMVGIIPTLRFEYDIFSRSLRRVSTKEASHMQRTLRQLLNVLNSFAASMDGSRIVHVPLLGDLRQEMTRVVQGLGDCLRALQGMVQRRLAPTSAAEHVLVFGEQVQRLFLRVLLTHLPDCPASGQGMAFLAMLLCLASLCRMLCISLTRTFHGAKSEAAAAVETQLGGAAWDMDSDVLATATGVLGMAPLEEDEDEEEGEGLREEEKASGGGSK